MRRETAENSQRKKAPNAWVYGLALIMLIAYVSLLALSHYSIASVYQLLSYYVTQNCEKIQNLLQ
jgi:high-affinity K+ transport system ATPase subunit B